MRNLVVSIIVLSVWATTIDAASPKKRRRDDVAARVTAAKASRTKLQSPTVLVVTEAQREAANAAVVRVCGPYARDTFSVPYTDSAKKTYYVASWRMTAKQEEAVRKELGKLPGKKLQTAKTKSGQVKATIKSLKLNRKQALLSERRVTPKETIK